MRRIVIGLFALLIAFHAEARLPIEQLQRDIQIRYVHTTQATDINGNKVFLVETPRNEAHRLVWLPTTCSDIPPAYPSDLFYGAQLRPEEETFLVQDIINKLSSSEPWIYYVTVDGESQISPVSRPSFIDTACTTNNCQSQFAAAQSFVSGLDTVRSRPEIGTVDGGGLRAWAYELGAGDAPEDVEEREGRHALYYEDLVNAVSFNPSGSGRGSSWFSSDQYYDYPEGSGFVWDYKQWDSVSAWQEYVEFYDPEDPPPPNTSAFHFTQLLLMRGFVFLQPDFDEIMIQSAEAEVFIQIDSIDSIATAPCYPSGFSAEDMGSPIYYASLARGEVSDCLYTAYDDIPEIPDPLEGVTQRVCGWSLNVPEVHSVVRLNYKPIADNGSGCASCLTHPSSVHASMNSMHVSVGLGFDATGDAVGVLELGSKDAWQGMAALGRARLHSMSATVQATYTNGLLDSITAPQCKVLFTALSDPDLGFVADYYMRPNSASAFGTKIVKTLIVVQGMSDATIATEWASGDLSHPGEYSGDKVYIYDFADGENVKYRSIGPPLEFILFATDDIPGVESQQPTHAAAEAKTSLPGHLVMSQLHTPKRAATSDASASVPRSPSLSGGSQSAVLLDSPLTCSEWEMSIGNPYGEVFSTYTRDYYGSVCIVTRTKHDEVYGEAERTVETLSDCEWGWALMRSESGPSDDLVWSDFSYYTNVTDNGYGELKSVVHSDGSWERYEYDAGGDLSKTVLPFGDLLPDAHESLCRVHTMTTEQSGETVTIMDTESVQGVEVSRSYVARSPLQTLHIRCVAAGAEIGAPSNMVTATTYVQDTNDDSPFTGRKVTRIEHPDGTLTLKTYPDAFTEIRWSGQPDAGGLTVVDGQRTEIQKNGFGYTIERKVYDISSTELVASETVVGSDGMGRPIEWQYRDGTTRTTVPGCRDNFGWEVARDGMERITEYGPQGRVVYSTYFDEGNDPVTEASSYDAAGRMRKRGFMDDTYKDVWRESFEYDTAGRMIASENAVGGIAEYWPPFADGMHQISVTFNPEDAFVEEEFYADGQLFRQTGDAPHVQMEYGVEGGELYTKEIRLGDNGETDLWSKTYTDFLGRPYKTLYSAGSFEQSWFNDKGQVEKTVDRGGVLTLYAYNGKGERQVVAVDCDKDETIDYSGQDRVVRTTTEMTSAHGTLVRRATTAVWDQENADVPRVTAVRDVSVDGLQSWLTVDGQETHAVTTYTPAEAKRTDITTYPNQTQLISVSINGQQSRQEWKDAGGNTARTVDSIYGEFGRLVKQEDSQQGTAGFEYYDNGLLASRTRISRVDGASTQVESYGYDDAMRVTSTTNADGSVTYIEYAYNGQLQRQYGAGVFPVEYGYDVQGRRITMTTWQEFAATSGAATTTWIYNPTNGGLEHKEYDDGSGPDYTYTPSGRIASRIWARGKVTEYNYDSLGQLTNISYSSADTPDVNYTYDRLGRVKVASSTAVAYSYAYTGDLLSTETIVMAGKTNVLVRHYDGLKRHSGYQLDSGAPVAYGYDDAGRLSSVSAVGLATSYNYGEDGFLMGYSIPGGITVSKGYDGFNRLAAISNATLNGLVSSYSYTCNEMNQRTSMQMTFGGQGIDSQWHYQYDAIGQLTNAWKTAADETVPGRHYGYAYDDIGNRTRTTRASNTSDLILNPTPVVTSDYTANLLNQYEERTIPAYGEVSGKVHSDAVLSFQNMDTGERIRAGRNAEWFHSFMPLSSNDTSSATNTIRMTAVFPGQGENGIDLINTNQTLTLSAMKTPQTFTHDEDGNLLTDGRFAYTWNRENRLVKVESLPDIPDADRVAVVNLYDPMGRRIQKSVSSGYSGGTYSTTNVTTFVWDAYNIIAEMSDLSTGGGAGYTNAYTYGLDLSGTLQGAGGVGGLISVTRDADATTDTYLYCFDGNGNVVNLIDASDSTIAATYAYTPFGQMNRSTGPMSTNNPVRWSTKPTDNETGLVMYPKRPYAPGFGRFISRDLIAEAGGINLYAFVRNTPPNAVDSLGLALYAFDGTANIPEDETNVYLTQASGWDGNKWYERGIGNREEHSALAAVLRQATGWGLSARRSSMLRVMERFINAGDTDVDIVGFSRGAVTAITFAEAVEKLKKENVFPYCLVDSIRFMGLYDPVPGPFIRDRPSIPSIVKKTSIAYSLDEKRHQFGQSMYAGAGVTTRGFRGGHSDVGGGYEDRGLANISLEWMIDQGRSAGASFSYPSPSKSPKMVRHQEIRYNIYLYNNRRGLGGVAPHPSVSRLVAGPVGRVVRTPRLGLDVTPYTYYLDSVAPGNDEYRVGDRRF
jgi:RHS repeat-associated protein